MIALEPAHMQETVRSSALHALIVDAPGQLMLAVLAHPYSRLVSIRRPKQSPVRAPLDTQRTHMLLPGECLRLNHVGQ